MSRPGTYLKLFVSMMCSSELRHSCKQAGGVTSRR
jgi:hypothetical protein